MQIKVKKIDLAPKQIFFYSKSKPTIFARPRNKKESDSVEHEKKLCGQEIMRPARKDAEDHKIYKSKGF